MQPEVSPVSDHVLDVIRFVVQDNRDLYPYEAENGSVVQPDGTSDAHTRLWRSTRGLMEQLERETNSTTEDHLVGHFDHVLSKRAQLIFNMVRDHAANVRGRIGRA